MRYEKRMVSSVRYSFRVLKDAHEAFIADIATSSIQQSSSSTESAKACGTGSNVAWTLFFGKVLRDLIPLTTERHKNISIIVAMIEYGKAMVKFG